MKHWYNNGIISKFCEDCPEGFVTGRINKKLTAQELKNKEATDTIINSVEKQDFIAYYLSHTVVQTLDAYNIKSEKILRRVLMAFNYDFSKAKPSRFKEKTAARSHESYIAGGQKSAETQKEHWQTKSTAERQAWAQKMQESHASDEFKQKIKQINIDYQAGLTDEERQRIKQKRSKANKDAWKENKEEILEKAYSTKKANQSFNSSKAEENYYSYLLTKFSADDIYRQYKDVRYPHACDFYIKSKDLFIELNLNWTHGGHPYDPKSEADIEKLNCWQDKAAHSKFYKKAITTWTRLDTQKFEDAKNNNLNYIAYYLESDLYKKDSFLAETGSDNIV